MLLVNIDEARAPREVVPVISAIWFSYLIS